MHSKHSRTADARRAARRDLAAGVTVDVEAQRLSGDGENISADGVLLTIEAGLRVSVRVVGEAEPRTGEVVRLTPLDGGRRGLAIRFDRPERTAG